MPIADTLVRTSACPSSKRRIELFDTTVIGFTLEVRVNGGKTFYLRYRDVRGKQRQYRIGDAKSITFEEAKKEAQRLRGLITLGHDPAVEKAILRQVPTFGEFIEQRYLPFVKGYKRSWQCDDSLLRNHLLPALGKKYLDEIRAYPEFCV